ncbi:MAG: hypothetical protein AAGA29_03640 [Planctomycetota bacterium]
MRPEPEQLADARRRASCVGELRLWQMVGNDHEPFDELLKRLRRRFPQLRISRTSLYRWARQADRDRRETSLMDHRGGAQRGVAWLVRRWWIEYRDRAIIPLDTPERASDMVEREYPDDALRRLVCVAVFALFRHEPPECGVHNGTPTLVQILRLEFPDLRVSRTSLHRWTRRYAARGMRGLVDTRGGDRRSSAGVAA